MKTFPKILTCSALVATLGAGVVAADTPNDVEAKPLDAGAIRAEIWPFNIPRDVSSKVVFEQWRAQHPLGEPQTLALNGLSIPAREASTMVRVGGVFIAPLNGDYAFTIHAPGLHRFQRPDETELWIQDDQTGGWRLAQCTGNPNKSGGRTRLEGGVPRHFELWTMGRNQTVVDWEVADFGKIDPATGHATLKVARQMIPGIAIGLRTAAADDPYGAWKSRHGLADDDGIGPNGPWGDPDGDGLCNWQEQLAGTDPLKADTEGRAGLVRWEVWRDIPGRYVFDLRRAGHFPTGPHEVRFLDRLEIPTGNGDQYGSRVRGWLVAPADGEYRFGISADDGAELWLGENESWQSKRLIAQADLHVAGQLRWFRRNETGENVPMESPQTGKVTLKAGSRYYIEILHKQGLGPDHCAVSWIKPGAEKPERITKEHLVSWQPCPTDTGDDGLPDDWQRSAKLMEVDASMRHAEADADGDGASNSNEWRAGTDPLNRDDAPKADRMLTSEAWLDIPGHRIADLVTHAHFPARPAFTTRVDNPDFGHEGENYGVRLRGYVTAPADGIYHFAISGNNSGILYLGESEDKLTKRVIARAEHGTDWRFFSADPRQRSGPVELHQGRRYYIEILYKRGAAEPTRRGDENDHSSVAWTRPGFKESVIGPEFFSPYLAEKGEVDDDLPIDWKTRHNLDPGDPSGKNGAWGDPDGDGLENFSEFQLGLDPNAPDVHGTPGLALWEYWDDREDLMPALRDDGGTLSERIREDIRFPLSPVGREWRESLESPRGVGVNYASRMRAVIIAPETGDYVFAISSHHAGELFLSSDASKFNLRSIASIAWASRYREWHNHESQVSAPVHLEAGAAYYIEALHAQGRNPLRWDHLCVAWKPPGSEKFEVIGSEHLVAFFRDPNDQDDDGLLDDWEKRYRLDTTDPHGDHGPSGDPDRDGLTNMQEYRLGSDPRNGDSDGDGVPDHDEINVYGSDPLVKDIIPPVDHHRFGLATGTLGAVGTWVLDDEGALTSGYRRGTLVFEFEIGAPGVYALALEAGAVGTLGYIPSVPVTVSINETVLGHADFPAQSVTRKWLTPWLPAGKHTVHVENRNVRANINLRIIALTLARFENGDSHTGIPDWLSKLLSSRNHAIAPAKVSKVSPWFVEGTCRFPKSVSLTANGAVIAAHDNLAGRWHADIPLPEDGSAAAIGIDFENGAITGNHEISWAATNLTEAPLVNHLRVGDSIRVTAHRSPEGSFTLRMGDRIWEKQAASAPVTLVFDEPGMHLLSATLEGGETIASTYYVHRADFGAPLALVAGSSRVWSPADIRHPLEVTADEGILLTTIEGADEEGTGLVFQVHNSSPVAGPLAMVARLPGNGPIVATGTINALRLSAASKTGDAHVIGTLPDGTRVVEVSYIIEGPIPADLSIWVRLYVTDAVFANGLTWLQLTAADFDENGVASFNVLKAPGTGTPYVCHWILPYADFEDVLNLRPVE